MQIGIYLICTMNRKVLYLLTHTSLLDGKVKVAFLNENLPVLFYLKFSSYDLKTNSSN